MHYVYTTVQDIGYITAGKLYEFTPDYSMDMKEGTIVDDDGDTIYIITEYSTFSCAFLGGIDNWKFSTTPFTLENE